MAIDINPSSVLSDLSGIRSEQVPSDLRRDYVDAVNESSDAHKAMDVYARKYEGGNAAGIANGQTENKPKVNLIASTIEQMVAMNSWKNPRITALPVETGDVQQSHVVNALFRFWQHHLKLRDLQERMNRMGFIYGTALGRVNWIKDPNAYERGEFRVLASNPMNFQPDPHATCLEDMRHCTFDTVWSVEAAEEQWPNRVPLASSVLDLSSANLRSLPPRSVVVHETYYAPTKKHKEGRLMRWTSFGLLEKEGIIETPDHRYPFAIFYNVPSTTSFWGISEVHNMIPIQAAYNNILWWIMQALRYVSVNKYVTNDISLKGQTINMDPTQPLVLEGGDKAFFKAIDRPEIDSGNMAILGMLFADLQQVSGIHGVQQGNPGAVTAATALQTLAMLGSQRMDTRKLHMADTMGDIAELLLEMAGVGKLYTKKHYLRILGEAEPVVLQPEHIRADFDIMCTYQESFPEEINARLQMMAQMAAMKPEQRALIARWTGDPLLVETAMEFAQALKEGAATQAQPTVGTEPLPAPIANPPATAQAAPPTVITQDQRISA
jgi:hypothetical protein